MHNFLTDMQSLNLQNRKVAIIENGSWAIRSGTLMKQQIEKLKHMEFIGDTVTMASGPQTQTVPELELLADAIAASFTAEE